MQEIYPEWIRRKIEEYRNWMIGVRRQLHRYPETGDQEYETTKYIQNLLKEMEFEIENPLPTGVIGILKPGGTGGNCVALRADIDALPFRRKPLSLFVRKETDICTPAATIFTWRHSSVRPVFFRTAAAV